MVKKDLFGQALHDYWYHNKPEDLYTWTHLTDKEKLPVSYLFRSYNQMPETEQKALQIASGKILDVGAGSGIHSLYLQNKGKDVTALELSPISCQLMKDRGIKKIINQDFFDYSGQKFDTVLFLMNGIGIIEKAIYADRLFQKLKELLTSQGQALIHSSDLEYLYQTDAGNHLPTNGYYGDVDFYISYKGQIERFEWTYIDEQTLKNFARQNGFQSKKIAESIYGDFLLQVKLK